MNQNIQSRPSKISTVACRRGRHSCHKEKVLTDRARAAVRAFDAGISLLLPVVVRLCMKMIGAEP